MVNVLAGDRIYYTGDRANLDAWGTVEVVQPDDVVLRRDDGEIMHIHPIGIGNVYRGHSSPRFVTAKAVIMYRAGLSH